MIRDLLQNKRGSVAVIFGLSVIPILGVAGIAVDYSRASSARTSLQSKSDVIALTIAGNGTKAGYQEVVSRMSMGTANEIGVSGLKELAFTGTWTDEMTFAVTATGQLDTLIAHVLPSVFSRMDLGVIAVARISEQQYQYDPPVLTYLDPDAGDYNQLYAYCFDYTRAVPSNPALNYRHRSQMTLIADNNGKEYEFEWPRCGEGESLSIRMRNLRHVRSHPKLLADRTLPPYAAEFDYYTDTRIFEGRETSDIVRENVWAPSHWPAQYRDGQVRNGFNMLETVLCDSLTECVGTSRGGVLPEGKNRNPSTSANACSPGKYMYFGWEDRPPRQVGASGRWTDPAWTDRSYDDIRIVMKCPDGGPIGDRNVRLIR